MALFAKHDRDVFLIVLAVSIAALCVRLGFWQIDRGKQRQQLGEYEQVKSSEPAPLLTTDMSFAELKYRNIAFHGRYLDSKTILLDNQVLNGRTGYNVISPFQLAGVQEVVLVNRGWIAASSMTREVDRHALKKGSDSKMFNVISNNTGVVVAPYAPKFINASITETLEGSMVRVQQIDIKALEVILAVPSLQPYVIRLDASAPYGYVRKWPTLGNQYFKNYMYAIQWFSFAVLSMVFLYFLVIRPRILKSSSL